MPRHRVIIIAKERPFEADKWRQLLTAFAYVLHEQRKQRTATSAEIPPPTKDQL